jgi:hypothetical protein
MIKPQLTEKEYIAELNKQLEEHEYYEKGMEFIPYPINASNKNIAGYSVRGPIGKIGVFAIIAHRVNDIYDLRATI